MILGVILVFSGYYTWDNFAKLIKSGFSSPGPTAALFVFSVLYFGIMTDAGMFDVLINNHAGPALTMCSTLMAAAVLARHRYPFRAARTRVRYRQLLLRNASGHDRHRRGLRDHSGVSTFTELTISLILI